MDSTIVPPEIMPFGLQQNPRLTLRTIKLYNYQPVALLYYIYIGITIYNSQAMVQYHDYLYVADYNHKLPNKLLNQCHSTISQTD